MGATQPIGGTSVEHGLKPEGPFRYALERTAL